MQIIGIDFTSAPRPAKPIVAAHGRLADNVLHISHIDYLSTLTDFATLLADDTPAFIGCDFPFGQPRPFLEAVGWGDTWKAVIAHIQTLSKVDFLAQLKSFRDSRPSGQKQLLRLCDTLAGATSPMMVYGVPVGRMWFVGAPLLLHSGISVRPNHPTDQPRQAFEVYPALVAKIAGVGSYKADEKRKQNTERQQQRNVLLSYLQSSAHKDYGVVVNLSTDLAEQCLNDATGDTIDALCAALQTAWAAQHPTHGLPHDVDPLEGWIVDPILLNP